MSAPVYEQRDQPEGVPPLALTGERTLPDVPQENYWYRRHLVVYEWIAARTAGKRVIDMACGEGYGSALLAQRAASVVGVDANPEAYEHARLKYRNPSRPDSAGNPSRPDPTGNPSRPDSARPNLRFARELVETFAEPADAVVFLQTIEHLREPGATLAHFRSLLADAKDGGVAYVSTPNVLTLAPPGAKRSDNPWHVHEYEADEFEMLCRGTFGRVELYGLYHTRKLRAHGLSLKLGWDAIHPRLRLTKAFYGWFTPAIAASDFELRPAAEADVDAALDFLAFCRP